MPMDIEFPKLLASDLQFLSHLICPNYFLYFQICIWFPLVCPICEREGKLDEQTLVKIYHLDSWCSQSHSHQVDLETLFLQQSLFCLFFFLGN